MKKKWHFTWVRINYKNNEDFSASRDLRDGLLDSFIQCRDFNQ